jgi:hypothetical protein
MGKIECGACGRVFDKALIKVDPTPAGCYWICPVCRQKHHENGYTETIMLLMFCILLGLFVAVLFFDRTELGTYECRSFAECRQLCALTEWHHHELFGTGEVPSEISDHDLRITGILESGGK